MSKHLETLQTLTEYIIKDHPDLLAVFAQIEASTKIIASKLRSAGLEGNYGITGTTNVYGDKVQKLDDFANSLIIKKLEATGQIKMVYSEELQDPVELNKSGKYIICMDPLDGSSNIDVNLNLGTIFSIYDAKDFENRQLPNGDKQICAGYVLYGTSCMMVMTFGDGVDGFTLDTELDSYFLTHQNITMPKSGKNYSLNENAYNSYAEPVQGYIDFIKKEGNRKTRYAAAMVADIHRFLIQGGVFTYPETKQKPKSKLRLMYEISPMSMIINQAGGKSLSFDGRKLINPLNIIPQEHDQTEPIILGSKENVDEIAKFYKD